MGATIWAPSEHTVNGVFERAVVAGDLGFELLFSVLPDRRRARSAHFHAKPDAERASRLMIEFKRLRVGMDGVCHLPDDD